jgi:GNAT superfamily N-acetyltransferase
VTAPGPERLFRALDATWQPARFVPAGPWTLREGRGGGQRVSAATVAKQVAERDLGFAEQGMRELNQRPLFMVRSTDAALDSWLQARGYEVVDPVTIYAAPVAELARQLPLTAATPSWPPLAVQAEIWEAAGIGPARLEVMARAAEKVTLLGRTGDLPAGTAFVAADGDVGMLHALEVDPAARRRGVGAALMAAAANWLAGRRSDWIAVAVTDANAAANALYRRLGMVPATHYHYRRAPEP